MKRWLTWFGLLLAASAFGRAVAPEVFSAASPVLAWPPSWQTAAGMLAYDADGNRVGKTVTPAGGDTATVTQFLVEDRNPTGYAQVMEERDATTGATQVRYVCGLDLISQSRKSGSTWTTHYYGYDGLGSVRYLTDANGAVTDTYTYDAFGIEIASTGTTPNSYKYTGEQYDGHLGMYYLRARFYKPELGRFWTMDSYEGSPSDPLSLHKYLYCRANPVDRIDPSGHFDFNFISLMSAMGIEEGLQAFKAGPEAAINQAVRQFGRDLADTLTFSDKNENKQIAVAAERLWQMRLRLMGLTVINMGDGVGKHGPDLLAFGWQGQRFRLIIGEVKGTRKSRVLSLLDKTKEGVIQMSTEWLSGFMDEVGMAVAKYAGQLSLGPQVGMALDAALHSGRMDLYLLRAKDLRDNSWELRGYRIASLADETTVARLHANPIDDIEMPRTIAYPSF